MKKFFKRFLLVFFLCICLVYVTNISSIPNSIILFDNEVFHFSTVFGVSFNEDSLSSEYAKPTLASITSSQTSNQSTLTVSLFNIIDLKQVEVNTIPSATVVPLGNFIGLKLYTSRCSCYRNVRN